MKFLFFLLGFYLLGLSCLPCNDRRECNAKAEIKVSASSNHPQHNHTKEACTPFCSCSCCPASAFYSPIPKTQVGKIALQGQKYPLYNVTFHSEVYSSIWQPPQLS